MSGSLQLCSFDIEARRYACPIAGIAEIHEPTPLRRLPQCQPHIAGLTAIRGLVHLVLDPRPLLGLPPTTEARRLLIIKPALAPATGFLIEGRPDVVTAEAARLIDRRRGDRDAAAGAERRLSRHDLVEGVIEGSQPLLLVLRLESLVRTIALERSLQDVAG